MRTQQLHPDCLRDRKWGEVVVAYIVPKAGADMDPVSLNECCIENMARFKRPEYYRAVDSLPKNNYGKVLKTKLRKMERGREQ